MCRYMLDTNIFNRLTKDGSLSDDVFNNISLFATHIQFDELNNTRDQEIRDKLLIKFQEIAQEPIATDTFFLNASILGKAKMSGKGEFYKKLLERIKELDKIAKKKTRDSLNQPRDALIAETAIKNKFTLITDDEPLKQATVEFGGQAISLDEFLNLS